MLAPAAAIFIVINMDANVINTGIRAITGEVTYTARARSPCTSGGVHIIIMIDHTGIGVANVAHSAAFYDAALGALGLRRVMQLPENDGADGVGYGVDYPVFWIDRFHPHGVKQHTAFAARSRAEVDSFHAAAIKAGGSDNGPPGLRDSARG